MSRKIPLSNDFDLPLDYATQAVGIVANRGSGKTYAANKIAEGFCINRIPFVAIDPMGVFAGLGSNHTGEKPGFPVVIIGGPLGHAPLKAHFGRALARWVADERRSCVLDLSELRKDKQVELLTAFLAELYHLNRDPLHLFVDEADLFAPQSAQKKERELLGIFEDVVRRGRVKGLGITLITQRPAVINKNVLTQISTLIMLRMGAPQDKNAIGDWIRHNADENQYAKVLSSLSELAIGQAWIYSPGWLGILKKLKIAARITFDYSSTPKVGEKKPMFKVRAKVDVGELAKYLNGAQTSALKVCPQLDDATVSAISDLLVELNRKSIHVKAKALTYLHSLVDWYHGTSQDEALEEDDADEDDETDDEETDDSDDSDDDESDDEDESKEESEEDDEEE